MAGNGVGLQLSPREAMGKGMIGSGLQQIGVLCRVGRKRRALIGLGRVVGVQGACLANGRAAPGLHAACDHYLGLTGGDQAHAHADGIKT
ncbi:hypothetical protein SDC9_160020 [bioreactor metagenome]|uniref:Uncharacterized protein n=1 Tax=bioreactor metagenome TaxID=1076179 RepID=A0A645FE96_9ZZZZ